MPVNLSTLTKAVRAQWNRTPDGRYLGLNKSGLEAPRAFPGAEGLAALTRGAAGYSGAKSIAVVSNLNDSGAGSFRDAVEGAGKEGTFVVFTVGGTIELQSDIRITSDYISVFGQTCPADSGGICLAGYKLIIGGYQRATGTHDLVFRHVRHRRGNYTVVPDSEEDTLVIWAKCSDIMFDHCSFSWGGDETVSLTNWNSTTAADVIRRITFSHCIISHGLTDVATSENDHGYGLLYDTRHAAEPSSSDMHNCLIAHHNGRMPQWGSRMAVNLINNIMYNPWQGQGIMFFPNTGRTDGLCNYIGNYVKAGPQTYTDAGRGHVQFYGGGLDGGPGVSSGVNGIGAVPYPALYMQNNYGINRLLDGDPEWQASNGYGGQAIDDGWRSNNEFTGGLFSEGVPVTRKPLSAATLAAFEAELLSNVGARLPVVDSYDQSVLDDVANGTGSTMTGNESMVTNVANFPVLASGTPQADTNSDGLPDEYETGLSVALGSIDPLALSDGWNGYLNIEIYAAQRAGDI